MSGSERALPVQLPGPAMRALVRAVARMSGADLGRWAVIEASRSPPGATRTRSWLRTSGGVQATVGVDEIRALGQQLFDGLG